MNQHHAFVVEAGVEEGVALALAWVERELGMKAQANPDIVVLKYGLFSVDDARRVTELAAGGAFVGEHRVVIIAATRAYHEAQNALLKLFEEPPKGTHLFFILPSLGNLLPTLRSRVQVLQSDVRLTKSHIPEIALEFMKMTQEKRSVLIKKLASGKDDDERREYRDLAIAIVNGIEQVAYMHFRDSSKATPQKSREFTALLADIAVLRGHLYDRSAPLRMILEHLSLVMPKNLV